MPCDSEKSAFFDELADDWNESVDHDPVKLERIVRLLGLEQGDRVLDVGCGTGAAVPYLLGRVGDTGEVLAIDVSPKMVAVARLKLPSEEYPNVKFVVGDVGEVGLDDEFNAILCYSCFPHFHDQRATIRYLAWGLKKGGTLVIAHSESRDAINAMHASGPDEICGDYLPPAGEIAEMMADAGLEVTETIDDEETFVVVGRRR